MRILYNYKDLDGKELDNEYDKVRTDLKQHYPEVFSPDGNDPEESSPG